MSGSKHHMNIHTGAGGKKTERLVVIHDSQQSRQGHDARTSLPSQPNAGASYLGRNLFKSKHTQKRLMMFVALI
jgi:hypothetical protein